MSQFEQGGPPGGIRRNPIVPVPQQGLTSTLIAPGLATIPPVSRGAQMADELSHALGLVGQVAGTIHEQAHSANVRAYQEQLDAERAQAKSDRLDAIQEHALRGQAALHAGAIMPGVLAKIATGDIQKPDGVDPAEFSHSLARSFGGTDFAPAYNDELDRRMSDNIANAIAQRGLALRRESIADTSAKIIDGAQGEADPEQLEGKFEALRLANPDMTEARARELIGSSALKYAVSLGDTNPQKAQSLLATAGKFLGDDFKSDVETAATHLDNQIKKNQAAAVTNFRSDISDLRLSGATYAEQRQAVEDYRKNPDVDPTAIDREMHRIDTLEREDLRQGRRLGIQFEVEHAHDLAVEDAAAHMRNGEAYAVQDSKFVDSEGHSHPFDRDKLVKEATESEMTKIASENKDPAASFGKQVEFLSRNGVGYEPWEHLLASGYLGLSNDISSDPKAGQEPQVGDTTVKGYAMYRAISAANPRLANSLVKSEPARRFYETAELAQKYVTPGDAGASLLQAAKAFQRGAYAETTSRELSAKALKGAVDTAINHRFFFAAEAKNVAYVGDKVEQLARFYMDVNGIDAASAVKEAAEKIKPSFSVMHGWAVETGNRMVPANIDSLLDKISNEYVAKHPDEALHAGDLVLEPGDGENNWFLFNRRTLRPVEHWNAPQQTDTPDPTNPKQGYFTSADLARRGGFFQTAEESARIAQIVGRQNELGATDPDRPPNGWGPIGMSGTEVKKMHAILRGQQ
jgi:hypothetical protein